MRKLLTACLIVLSLAAAPARAQSGSQAALLGLDLSAYPTMSVYLDASQANGVFLAGLSPTQVTLLEDDQSVEVTQLLEEHPGVEVITAINPAPAMAIRDSLGITRYEHVLATLQAWAGASAGEDTDTYSLLANGIQPTLSIPTRAELAGALAGYQPDFKRSLPGLESLAAALDIALSPPASPGTRRFILYITPPPEDEQLAALAGLRTQAEQSEAVIHVWMVASTALFDSPGADELAALASSTGGELFAYSGVESLPDLNAPLEGLGRIYSLQYKSQVQSGSSHTLLAEINLEGELVRTPVLPFDLMILSPSPMFLSPPAAIERSAPAGSETPLEDLAPDFYELKALVEFPDGRQRPLTALRLYIDGKLAVEHTRAPFDSFRWDLSGYTAGGTHRLRLEVEDSYGLKNSSLELPVDVSVLIPQLSLWEQLTRPRMLASLGALALAGLILGLVLFLAGRRRSQPGRMRPADRDPLTQPVRGLRDAASREGSMLWKRSSGPSTGAVLVPLKESGESSGAAIPLSGGEVTFGRDPALASVVLESSSVDNVHARMKSSGGVYTLADNGSVAGTWVNYAPITRDGLRLEHGDIIHFGRLAYRFLLDQPGPGRQATVRAYNDQQ